MSKSTITKKIFEKEISFCQKLSLKNKGKCNWGKCKDCGVIPLLYKLHKNILLEKSDDIKSIKRDILH